jgi:hypothetical protein
MCVFFCLFFAIGWCLVVGCLYVLFHFCFYFLFFFNVSCFIGGSSYIYIYSDDVLCWFLVVRVREARQGARRAGEREVPVRSLNANGGGGLC